MEVIIDVGNQVTFKVIVNDKSGYLYTFAKDFVSCPTVDLQQLFKNISNDSSSITDYVFFLTHDTKSVIFDPDIMIGCLKIYHLVGDDNYFTYLIKQLHQFWTLLSPIIYSNEIHQDIMRELLLHCPYQLLPRMYRSDETFLHQWKGVNINKTFTLDGDQEFTFKESSNPEKDIDIDIIYCHNGSNIKDSKIKRGDFDITYSYYNNTKHGSQLVKNGERVCNHYNYINDKCEGFCIHYHGNSQIDSQRYYHNGKLRGLGYEFYQSGQVKHEVEYSNDGLIIGVERAWYDDSIHTLKEETEFNSYISKHFYLNGNTAVITHKKEYDGHDTITLYSQDNKLIWKIEYHDHTKQIFFDDNGNITHEYVKENGLTYNVENEIWE